MTKPRTEQDLSDIFDREINWRRMELFDLKNAIASANSVRRSVLLRSFVTMAYAHWEGYVRVCAARYFEYFTIRRLAFDTLTKQFYVNSFLPRLDALYNSRMSVEERSGLIHEILDRQSDRFSQINDRLIDTKANLNTDTVKQICHVCAISPEVFEAKRNFIDKLLLKRRNAIAHGQNELIPEADLTQVFDETMALMKHFSNLLENNVYSKACIRV